MIQWEFMGFDFDISNLNYHAQFLLCGVDINTIQANSIFHDSKCFTVYYNVEYPGAKESITTKFQAAAALGGSSALDQ